MVDHAHDVALALAVGDLVDADPAKILEGVGHPGAPVGHDAGQDPAYAAPGDAQEAADRAL
jgi:hypothetical protein